MTPPLRALLGIPIGIVSIASIAMLSVAMRMAVRMAVRSQPGSSRGRCFERYTAFDGAAGVKRPVFLSRANKY